MTETIVELAAWGFDEYRHRPANPPRPQAPVRTPGAAERPDLTAEAAPFFAETLRRPDLQEEFAAFSFRLAVVDLRQLVAFQRRIVLAPTTLQDDDWQSLTALAFGPPRATTHTRLDPKTLQSENPDLHIRPSPTGPVLHGGSPFLEAAVYQQRTFLRDGYHRAYNLLSAQIHHVPAVLLEVNTFAELGANRPHFIPESILLSNQPPLVADFLNPALTLTYQRPRLFKTIHL